MCLNKRGQHMCLSKQKPTLRVKVIIRIITKKIKGEFRRKFYLLAILVKYVMVYLVIPNCRNTPSSS